VLSFLTETRGQSRVRAPTGNSDDGVTPLGHLRVQRCGLDQAPSPFYQKLRRLSRNPYVEFRVIFYKAAGPLPQGDLPGYPSIGASAGAWQPDLGGLPSIRIEGTAASPRI